MLSSPGLANNAGTVYRHEDFPGESKPRQTAPGSRDSHSPQVTISAPGKRASHSYRQNLEQFSRQQPLHSPANNQQIRLIHVKSPLSRSALTH